MKQIYYIMLDDIASNPDVKNWASMVKNTQSNLGFYHVWASQEVGNGNNFLTFFQTKTKGYLHIKLGRKAPCIDKEIASFGFHAYLDKLSIRKFRIALTRLRVSSHRLQIEAGRWSKPNSTPRNERLCRLCNK